MFDVCLMNPPFTDIKIKKLYAVFIINASKICKQTIAVAPRGIFYSKNDKQIKDELSKYLVRADEEASQIFQGTSMEPIAIYQLTNNKTENEYIDIYSYYEDHHKIKNLNDIKKFSEYEENFIKYLTNQGQLQCINCNGHKTSAATLIKRGILLREQIVKIQQDEVETNALYVPENKIYLVLAKVMDRKPLYMSKAEYKRTGLIFDDRQDLINNMKEWNINTGYMVACLNSIKAAENLRETLRHPLMRYILFKYTPQQLQAAYKYVPNINWEDDRVLTDEGLLEVCGCPKDKAKEYAEYCEQRMKIIDKKNENMPNRLR